MKEVLMIIGGKTMKKLILLLALAFVICGCSSEQTKELKDSQFLVKKFHFIILKECPIN